MPPKTSEATLARQARFVFRGKVQRLKAANVAAVEDKRHTVIVRVEQVEKAPEAMTGYAGQEITVKLAPAERVRPGEQARFYTNGWLYGETIAVESLGHVAATPRTAIAAMSEPAVNLETSNIEDRVANADIVVQGRVTSVRLPQENRAAMRMADARRPITEHDPEWREAVVEVAGVEKGALKKRQIVVRFPSSQDVRWYKAPKFQPGQEGMFILQRASRPKTRRRGRAAAAMAPAIEGAADAFVALHPADFQPLERDQEIRGLVKTTARPRKRK
ncbi:MAG TPA: hypothetical protein VE689_08860 [Candidatus Udaeobacter sp.]|jgi:hypothetical protein|nr:hypothetical protein [Candidatus Udaeobacter sp.]